ncbi:Glycosyltransferase involved in cell wall bisynthesis [Paracoccus aminovorans]|uniref:Glycosyltransferase involved in cell wall bisynthesis n=1 Tax=Paracoccus aminovorans TaxID=34004 RepID=A0A1I2XX23_9RHOB|nr:glycosyltransferase [Paracoccus aminovorans]CQR87184.1 glycosyl transferase [Paracoccus aminovorans]SFH17912.1 Glycosyltransferase involved in cell wall bisynthesis [Paracoccus aminovorans]
MRIGYLVNTYPRPSHSFIRREIAALEQRGFQVHRFAMRGDAAALTDPADLAEHDRTERVLDTGGKRLLAGLARQALAAPGRFQAAFKSARARARAGESGLARQIIYMAEGAHVAARARELGLRHLHAHFGTNSARVAGYARLFGGPPFSFTVHGPEEFDNVQPLDLGGKLALADFCVTVSSYGRSQMYRWAAAGDWAKVRVVHCGLDLDRWAEPAPLPPGPFHMVAVGRFAEQKGFGLLIRGFAHAWRQNPALRLSLVGDGELRPQIESQIAAAGMGEAVSLLGWQNEAGVRAAMNAAHALVTPSFAEGLPVVIMEAMACARPVIATYIAGIPELVRPGIEGWLVPAGDDAALAQAMLEAAETQPETLAAMGASARTRVAERHDIRESADRLSALFSRATG